MVRGIVPVDSADGRAPRISIERRVTYGSIRPCFMAC